MEDGFELNIGGEMSINYAEVTKSKDLLAVTRLLAADLIVRPYMPVGDYMKSLSDSDLQMLVDLSEDDSNPRYEDLILMSEMLAAAEGLPGTFDLEDVQKRIQIFVALLIVESLGRKGLVKVHRENYSFGDDMATKPIVEKLQ